MFGTLRLALAILVATSHLIGGRVGGVWIGVSAVVIFFMISGYAMTGLIQSRFAAPGSARIFYLERFVRLAPQYYLWLALAMLITLGLGWFKVKMEGFIPYGLFAYLTVIPLGLQRFIGSADTLLMAQASTLGVEITFYILSPWILKSRVLSWAATSVGLAIFAASAAGFIPDNIYTYYTSPGPIVFYMLGSFLFRKDWTSLSVATGILLAILAYSSPQHFDIDLMIGVVIGLPLLMLLARRPASKIDSLLGNASYGCYLGHSAIIMCALHFVGVESVDDFSNATRTLIILAACCAGYASFWLVERPTIAARRSLRPSPRVQPAILAAN